MSLEIHMGSQGGAMMVFTMGMHVRMHTLVKHRHCLFLLKLLEHLKFIADGKGKNTVEIF